MRTPLLRFPFFVLLALIGVAQPSAASEGRGDTIIVVDASGSMWGQVDGVPKIEIARAVFADLLGDWPAERQLGVIAYGHRRKGDCSDIERIIDVGPLDSGEALERINALKPKGRTPLTAAVEQAAEALRYQDVPATVILLTDGIETCERDPCKLAAALEQAGVGFTAHVVGFDVAAKDQPKIACIAENTGGLFVSADTAVQLGQAMRTVTVAPEPEPEPTTAEITLKAIDAESRAELPDALWSLTASDGDTKEFSGSPLTLELVGGSYAFTVRAGGAEVSDQLTVVGGRSKTHEILLSRPLPEASLEAPAEIPAGSDFQVDWTGPDDDRDFITIVEVGTPEGEYAAYVDTRHGTPAKLTAPDALGAYELRYVHGATKRTLASLNVTLTPIEATLEAPSEAPAGSRIEVLWSGPDNVRDYIAIAEPGAPEGAYVRYSDTRHGSPAKILLPDALGNYEIRYVVGQSKRTLATAPLTLVEVTATLEAPVEAPAGSEVEVHWTGPDNRGDYITIVEPGAPEGSYTKYTETRHGSPVKLQVPDALGAHEIRYVIGQSKRTLASAPITLVAVGATLEAPAEVPAGGMVKIYWTGPDNRGDYVTIVEKGAPEGTHTKYRDTRHGNPLELQAPDALGAHEIRYVIGQSKRTLASHPVTLVPVSANLTVDGPVVPGAKIEVQWQGPDNKGDYITIVEQGAPEGSHTDYRRTSRGSPLQLKTPEQPGDYEVRYVVGQSKRTLASVPVRVDNASVSLSVATPVKANGVVEISFEGPGRYQDMIEIVPVGATPKTKALRSSRASQGSPIKLFAPPGPGSYEIRYRLSDTGEVAASIPLTVE